MALTRIALVSHNPASLALFYQTALNFSRVEHNTNIRLRYGDSLLDILSFDPPGKTFPPAQASNNLSFQHFAMITPDINAAHQTLSGTAGWRPISRHGPVKLPPNTGSVTAFKFRDPEGHPLEFLQPAQPTPARIDHSAIVVSNTKTSIAFYETFGLSVKATSLNQGPEQATLDALETPIVEVTRLGDAAQTLHLELLCYRTPPGPAAPHANTDIVSTRLIFSGQNKIQILADPDGHVIVQTA